MARIAKDGVTYSNDGNYYQVPDQIMALHDRQGERLWLPAVSFILDSYQAPSLRDWYGRVGLAEAERIKNDTGNVGTVAHAVIERIIGGARIEPAEWNYFDERLKQCIRAWLRWYQTAHYTPHQAEQPVYSLRYGYAGTLDSVGLFGTVRGIADWKTTSKSGMDFSSPSAFLQVCAYRQAYHEMHEDAPRIKEVRVVTLCRDNGTFKEAILTGRDLREAFQAFLYMKKIWNFLHRRRDG